MEIIEVISNTKGESLRLLVSDLKAARTLLPELKMYIFWCGVNFIYEGTNTDLLLLHPSMCSTSFFTNGVKFCCLSDNYQDKYPQGTRNAVSVWEGISFYKGHAVCISCASKVAAYSWQGDIFKSWLQTPDQVYSPFFFFFLKQLGDINRV